MGVQGALRRIDDAVEESLDARERYEERQTGKSRRTVYEKSIREVQRIAGETAGQQLGTWIASRIREDGRLPSGKATRKRGADICRENGHEVSSGSWLGT
ncbi:hypothetical protein [Halorussus halophilus]|uniref:hypothetical protein n=1 Tax=Halorussus halophilus TaxID=2650975 RepID=UPI0013011F23|nr:hypothetical protein [Halorussus halophilus]